MGAMLAAAVAEAPVVVVRGVAVIAGQAGLNRVPPRDWSAATMAAGADSADRRMAFAANQCFCVERKERQCLCQRLALLLPHHPRQPFPLPQLQPQDPSRHSPHD
jgi:hypothetical protein